VTGTAPTLNIAVGAASTVAPGVVQLNDSTNSTSTIQALTANAGNVLQQQINALAVSSNITLAGTIDAATGLLVTVTTEGVTNGFAVGSPLPAADTANDNYFTIVTVAGTMTPPGGSAQVCHVGDWWLSNGTIWQFLDVAAPAPVVASATPTTEGVVFGHTDNTTNYNTSLGYDALLAPTASGVANVALGFAAGNAVSNGYGNTLVGGGTGCALTDGTVNVAVGFGAFSGATTAFANAVFGICSGCAYTVESGNAILGGYYGDAGDTNTVTLSDGAGNLKAKFDSNGALSFDGTTFGTSGQVLTSNGGGSKPTWQAVPAGGIPCSTITGKGAIVTGTSASTPSALPVGNYGEVLIADSGCATGLKWGAVPAAGPIGRGTVFGCTMDTSGANNLAIGYYSLAYTSATCSVVIGNSAMIGSNGLCHIAIGTGIGATGSGTDCNVLVGNAIGSGMFQNSSKNVVLGHGAGKACFNASNGNVVIGAGAGPNLDMACQNVVIGCGVTIPTTGTDCALAIGFATGCHWLTGDSTKAIKPGAGIIDCANSCGTAGQVLMSTGSNGVCWGSAGGGGGTPVATPTVVGTLFGCSNSAGTLSTAVGYNALLCNPTGNWNVAVGSGAGQFLTSGQWNTFIGSFAGNIATTAAGSVAVGINAAQLSNGSGSIAIGNSAGYRSGNDNVAVGNASMSSTCTCTTRTVAIGSSTARFGSGNDNVTIGFGAACVPSCGGCNTVIGSGALQGVGTTATTAPCNTSLGFKTLNAATTACLNVALGFAAGCSITSGAQNVLIGPNVGATCTTEACTLAIGYSNTALWLTGDSTKAIKPGAGIIDCAGSCGTAGQVLMSNGLNAVCWGTAGGGGGGTPATPTALGTLYGCSDPDIVCNTALGYNALLAGGVIESVAIGGGALECSAFGSYNTAVGYHSQRLGDGSRNTSVGTYALCQATLEANVAIGSGAGCELVAGRYNVIIGTEVQTSSPSSECELAIGYSTGQLWLSGDCTKAIKPGAGVIDCANSCGTAGQVLTSNGSNAIQWATPQTSPFITYTTSAVSYTSGTPILVAKWYDGTMQGTLTLDLAGYGGINQMWDFYLSGQSTNYNTGWYQTASYPASSSDPLSQGTWYVDFPVYPDPDANVWMIYFSPSQNSLNPSTFTFFYRLFPGSSTPAFQI
jgi:hypothetical protein